MTGNVLADLRLDLRDLRGVTFVATVPDDGCTRLQVAVDDPSVAPEVERSVMELSRRHLEGPVDLDLLVAGVCRTDLALARALRELDDVRSVELERGRRGEVLRVAVTTGSPEASARVRSLIDQGVGASFRRRRVEVREAADA